MILDLIKVDDVEKIEQALCKLRKSIQDITKYSHVKTCEKYSRIIGYQINSLSNINHETLTRLENNLLVSVTMLSSKKLKLNGKDTQW